ncbi:wall-associated receptor kinase-like 6 [Beta vulgaris subsp. vulgaris]|uniref:wall-associated receptor kinase-like 6 n=1 Tax=Beta vulgaris subsp. vulgaris TaxID=3555 RepID=UPI00053FE1B8|nr:wall-associated receptor kinase-like 6 [Beta vulgaris subsp. vulgaris]
MFLVSTAILACITWTWLLLAFPCTVQASFSNPSTMLTAANTTKPGCPRMCGNLTIPYPFGIGKDCAMGDDYVIKCITVNGTTYAVYVDDSTAALDISETELTLTATPAAQSCNSVGTTVENRYGSFHVTGKPYALSSTANKFIVTGCHHYGLIEAQTRAGRKVISCVALCTKVEDLLDETCSGLGCCEAHIPKGLQDFNASLEKIVYNTTVSSGNCSYAFIAKHSSINFRRAIDLLDPRFASGVEVMSAVLDWFIANATCRVAQRNSATYACQQNTSCIDLDKDLNVHGYRCKCLSGYEGNPYLSPGCTDINECKGSSNPCSGICMNTPGSYKCHCPKGYRGDGRKDGTGCLDKSLSLAFPLGLGIGLGSILFILGGYWLLIVARRRKKTVQKTKNFERNGGLLLQQQMSSTDGMVETTRVYTADELEKATDNYNEDRVLGQGGQGTVYKGMLSDGNIVAIKKSKIGSNNQLRQFINEVVILSQINHRNIVKLLGCCLETEVPLLVYEFVPNGTLSMHIHGSREDFPITWEMRLQIAIDVAGALTYLHSASSKPIFHRDIKTSNILLDLKYRAKLSDFGTSRTVDVDQTHLTTRVQGTFGYLDPEYFRSNQFTEKSDVYGFGVVLVELLTGKRAIIPTESHNGMSLVSWFLSAIENSNLCDNLAARVANEGTEDTILAVAYLAKRCLNMDGKQRPTMREVAVELEMISQLHHAPVSAQKNLPKVSVKTLAEITDCPSDYPLPPYTSCTEEDWSLPSNWSTASAIQQYTFNKSS